MKNCIILTILTGLILCTGCAGWRTVNDNVPHTTITGKICNQPFSIENPKDTILEGLEVTASTNGSASIRITRLSTVMNPASITATGDAGDKLVRATGDQVRGAIQDGITLGTKIAGAAVGNPLPLMQQYTPSTSLLSLTNQP